MGRHCNDLIGKRFGMLLVVGEGEMKEVGKKNPTKRRFWDCLCDCGNRKRVTYLNLKTGMVKSCGCLNKKTQNSKETKKRLFGARKKCKEENALGLIDGTEYAIVKDGVKLSKRNKSGVRGVFWDKDTKKWRACINFKKKRYYLGYFDDLENAKKIREQAERELFLPFCEWYENNVKKEETRRRAKTNGKVL